jgi:bacillithiol biosynthesis cysteine-adding enzyme BshC
MPHPDDESIYLGGTLAGLSAAGHRVRLLTVTDGAGGRGGSELSSRRRAELSEAARVLGLEDVRALAWADFGKYTDVARTKPVTSGDTLRAWGLDRALDDLVTELRRARPRRVLGLHPNVDPNLSLHGHHLGLGLLLAIAFHAAADPTFAPEAGPAWAIEEHRVVMAPCHAAWAEPFEVDRQVKRRALQAHRSQRYSTARLIEALADHEEPALEYTRRLQGHSAAPWVVVRRSSGQPTDAGIDWKTEAARVTDSLRPRTALVEVLRQQAGSKRSEATDRSLRTLLRENSVAVVTGQQVGLLGGPVYTLAKALSAVAQARRLTRLGVEAVAVFWLASQDHDLHEVQRVPRLDAPTLDLGLADDGSPVGSRPLGPEIEALWERFVDELPSDYDRSLVERLGPALSAGETFRSSFTAILREATRGTGLLVLDPDDPTFSRLAAPLLRRAMDEPDEIDRALAQARARLVGEDKREVITTERGVSQLFLVGDDGKRRRVSRHELDSQALRNALRHAPQRLSAAALLRPLVQDFVLPTIAIVAGPTEQRYLDQTQELYEWANLPRPQIISRSRFLPIESRDAKALRSAGGVAALRHSSHPFADIGYAALPPETARWFGQIDSLIADLSEADSSNEFVGFAAVIEPAREALEGLPRLRHTWPHWRRVLLHRSESVLKVARTGIRTRARGRLRGELLRLRRSVLRDGRRLAGPALDAWARVGPFPAPPERRMTVAELLARGGSNLSHHLLAALESEPSPELELWFEASS